MHLLVTDTFKKNGPHYGPQDLVTVFLCIQIATDKMQLCLLSVAHASPYHNPTAIMRHFTKLTNRLPTRRHTRGTAKFSKTMLKFVYGRDINITFSVNSSGGHSGCQHANCMLPQNLRHL